MNGYIKIEKMLLTGILTCCISLLLTGIMGLYIIFN